MAVKVSIAKAEITHKILEGFPESFVYNYGKEIRINTTEEGEIVQIKLTLTCAKIPVSVNVDVEVPRSTEAPIPADCPFEVNEPQSFEPTEEEKENLQKLMSKLGL